MNTAIILPNENGIGVDVGWIIDNPTRLFAIMWGNFRDADTAKFALHKAYPDAEIVESTEQWPASKDSQYVREKPMVRDTRA